jgi:hypothetical protein
VQRIAFPLLFRFSGFVFPGLPLRRALFLQRYAQQELPRGFFDHTLRIPFGNHGVTAILAEAMLTPALGASAQRERMLTTLPGVAGSATMVQRDVAQPGQLAIQRLRIERGAHGKAFVAAMGESATIDSIDGGDSDAASQIR